MKIIMPGIVTSKHQRPFSLKIMVASLAGAGIIGALPVAAQEASTPAAGDIAAAGVITVTGVRKSAESAQKIKKDSDEVMDSIVADDIGKFPDTNVAETLAHVTGIQILRNSYEVTGVTIDGLPDVATLLNGRDVFTSTGRYISLADIPSTMLQRVDVYKSTSADLIEGGTVGTIDVRTNRPFDFKGYTLNVKGGVNNEDKAKSNDPNLSMMVSDRWKTPMGDFGALMGLSYIDTHYHREAEWNGSPILNNGLIEPGAVGVTDQDGNIRRSAENLAFQWRPSAGLEFYAEGMSMHYLENNNINFFLGFPGGNQQTTTYPGTNVMDSMTSSNAFGLSSTQANANSTVTQQGAIGGRWDATSELKITSEIARTISRYNYINPILDTNTFTPTASYQTNVNGAVNMNFSGINMTDPKNWTLLQFFDHFGHDSGQSTDWRADAVYTPEADGLFKEFSSGIRLSSRSADSLHSINNLEPAPFGQISVTGFNGMSCVSPALTGSLGVGQWYQPCANYLLNNTSAIRQAVTGTTNPIGWDPGSFIQDVEKTYSWYGKAKFAYDIGKVPVDGVFGLRVVRTNESLTGNDLLVASHQYVPVQDDRSATDVLPSMSLKFHLNQELIARLTASKTVARPTFGQLNPATTYTYVAPPATGSQTVTSSASGGNPDLKPYTTDNYNGTLEWYFSPTGYLAGGLYRHNFKGYVAYMSTPETFEGNAFQVSRPFNTEGGSLQGVEFAYQQFFDKLPGWLSGFGFAANATFAEGGLTSSLDPAINNQPFAGMSRYSYNLTGLYEKNGWSGRLAFNWRSRFTDTYNYAGSGYNLTVSTIAALDGSLSYQVNKNVTVNLTGNNLLNFNYHDSFGVFPRDSRYYDRTLGLSVALKL